MKKLITKTLSMILMLAMVLSMTAMAASTTSTDAYESTPNAYAWYKYMHRDYVWNSGRNGGDSHSWATEEWFHIKRNGVNYEHNYNLDFLTSTGEIFADGHRSDGDYRQLSDYNSPYGDPRETAIYLETRFGFNASDRFIALLDGAFHDIDSRIAAGCYSGITDGSVKNNNSAKAASNYLEFITTELDNNFVYLYETYGENVACKYAKDAIGIGGDKQPIGLNAEEWLDWKANKYEKAINYKSPIVYQPINTAPMNGAPVANDPNKAVATKMTVQVNGVARTFDVMTLHGSTFYKLADLADAMGFKYHRTNDGVCISNGATYTLCHGSFDHSENSAGYGKIFGYGSTGTKTATIETNGLAIGITAVCNIDARGNGDMYYYLRDIAHVMNFNVDWTPETGTTISNKSSFDEGVNGRPGQWDSYVKDTSTWDETTHTFAWQR